MYIGACYQCKQYCQEEEKRKFEKYHEQHRHNIFDEKAFKEENKDFMRKSKRAWNSFAIRLESFFKKLKKEIEFIENQARDRLEYEEVKTAISTNDNYLANITTDIMQERYRNLTCQDIDEFIRLRKKQQTLSHVRIDQEERDFAKDIVQQLQQCFQDTARDFSAFQSNSHAQHTHQANRAKIQEETNRRVVREEKDERRPKRQPNELKKKTENQKRYKRSDELHQDISDAEMQKSAKNNETQASDSRRMPRRQRYEDQPERVKFRKDRTEKTHQINTGTENKIDQPCPVLKISELSEQRKAFTIEVTLVNFIKQLYDKEVWKVSDETGEVRLVIPSHASLKNGAKVTLKNCFVKAFGQTLQIHTKLSTKISPLGSKQEVLKPHTKANTHKRYHRQGKDEGTKQKGLTKIEQITPDCTQIKLIAKVLNISRLTQDKIRCVLGDETGIIAGEFIGFESLLKEKSVIYLRGLQADVDGEGHMFITGKKILMEPAHDDIRFVKESNNMSEREYEQVEG